MADKLIGESIRLFTIPVNALLPGLEINVWFRAQATSLKYSAVAGDPKDANKRYGFGKGDNIEEALQNLMEHETQDTLRRLCEGGGSDD